MATLDGGAGQAPHGDSVASVLADLCRALPLDGARAVLGVPDELVRRAQIMVPAALSAQARYLEAEARACRLFGSAQPPAFDYIERRPPAGAAIALEIVAAPVSAVQHCVAVAAAAGLRASVVDVNGFAALRARAYAGIHAVAPIATGSSAEAFDPFAGMTVARALDAGAGHAGYAVATGLALRGLA